MRIATLPVCFNPRTHTGCDTRRMPESRSRSCFNPRTHTGCDTARTTSRSGHDVSIHAPTRGATCSVPDYYHFIEVSIHAPTRGATERRSRETTIITCFNPRTHTGCDSRRAPHHKLFLVSIHAPTRGATSCILRPCVYGFVSIHAPTRGATVCKVTYYKSIN